MINVLRIALLVSLPLLWSGRADAQPVPEPDTLRVHVLTLGPGLHPFFKFGHNAIWIQDTAPGSYGQGQVYNFGTFAFDTPGLIPKFMSGRFTYWLSVQDIESTIAVYRDSDRTVVAQELNLTPAQKRELKTRLDENALPQNRDYLYDYFRDNCSTRVRDAIDRTVGGQVKAALQSPSQQSYRQHALRLTADLTWEYVALYFALGGYSDQVRTRYDESFVPEVFRRSIREMQIESEGGKRPLVRTERVLYKSTRPPPLESPPQRGWTFLMWGIVSGLVLLVLCELSRRAAVVRILLGTLLTLQGFVFGLLSVILLLLWLFTDHRAAYGNANLLLMPPWLLAMSIFGVGIALRRERATRRAATVILACVATSILLIPLKILPILGQDNGVFIAFFLPHWALLAIGLRRLANYIGSI
jgi:Domain of unknown function (DUF4105)